LRPASNKSTTPKQTVSVLVVAGETSGESHAADLISSLRSHLPESELDFFGSGGARMREQGVELLMDVSELAAIGPWAALGKAANYVTLFRAVVRTARERKPKFAILVDFPDFNLRLASRLKRLGIPVCYYISPQLWAWRQSRVKLIRRYVDLMLVILPFEKDFFRSHGIEAVYVGNPTASRLRRLGVLESDRQAPENKPPVLALLPGSRQKEVELILPVMLEAARFVSDKIELRCWIIRSPGLPVGIIRRICESWRTGVGQTPTLEIQSGGTDKFLQLADVAMVKSGTSTLEAMLLGIPFAMVYRLSFLSWVLLRPFVTLRTYCLANLVAGRRIVPEFVQRDARAEKIGAYLSEILEDSSKRSLVADQLRKASAKLGDGDSYREAADQIVKTFFSSRK
jgi:lipid-A-disaccharide synthase